VLPRRGTLVAREQREATFGDYYARWVGARRISSARQHTDDSRAANHVLPYWERWALCDIRPSDIDDWIGELAAKTMAVTITMGDQGDFGPVTVDVPVLSRLDGDGVVLARSPWAKDRDDDGPKPIALLWLHRPPLITCPVRPPMRRTRPAVQHKVTADVNDRIYELIVWELVVPAGARPVSAATVPTLIRAAA